MASRLVRIVAFLVALSLVAAACGDDDDQSAPETTAGPGATTSTSSSTTTSTTTMSLPLAVEVTQDVPYTSQGVLDVYAPAEGSGWPVVVHFHGGFSSSEEPLSAAFAQAIAEQGVVVAVPSWRSLGPDGGSEDTVCATAFATERAADYGGDAENITLSGYSTGGFTAVVHALIGDDPPLPVTDCEVDPTIEPPQTVVGGGAPLFAAEWARAGLFDANPQWNALTPEQIDAFDPYLALGRNPELEVRLVVGEDDVGGQPDVMFPIAETNREYYAALVEAGYDAELTEVAGGHLEPTTPGTESWDAYVTAVVEAAQGA